MVGLANTLLAGAKSSQGTTQPKMNPQPDTLRHQGRRRREGAGCQKKNLPGNKGEVFFLDIPFYRTRRPEELPIGTVWGYRDPSTAHGRPLEADASLRVCDFFEIAK